VVRLLHGYSIYETTLLSRGIRIVRGRDANRLRSLRVRDTMQKDYTHVRSRMPLPDLIEMILKSPFPHFIVLDADDRLDGVLSLRDVRAHLSDPSRDQESVVAADLMSSPVVTVREDQSLEEAFHLFSNKHFSFLPVVSTGNPGKVVGLLRKDDLLNTYDQQILSEQVQPSARWICKLPEQD
jgi:CIC family chloride channel protein